MLLSVFFCRVIYFPPLHSIRPFSFLSLVLRVASVASVAAPHPCPIYCRRCLLHCPRSSAGSPPCPLRHVVNATVSGGWGVITLPFRRLSVSQSVLESCHFFSTR